MKKKFCRVLLLLLCFVLVSATVGCKDGKQTEGSSIKLSKVNEFPITKEKAELSIFIPKPSMIADITTNEFTKWYEEKTGVHINWIIASGDPSQALSLRLASGDLPDIIFSYGLSLTEVFNYGKQGVFIDLKDYIDDNTYYFKNILEKRDDLRKKLTTDGSIYGLPCILESAGQRCLNKLWVYQPWLDKLGLQAPTTTDEFYQMLKMFKEKDPNGNGISDEIPLGSRGIRTSEGIEAYIMNAFTYDSVNDERLYIEKGKVRCAAVSDGYRDGLRYIKKLYDEGLLLKDTFIIDRNGITSIGENEKVPILGACTGQWPGMFTLSGSDSGRILDYKTISPVKGPTGLRQTPRSDVDKGVGGMFNVTSACKNPALALKWVDWFYSNEGRIKQQGVKNYRKAKEGEIALNGKQAKYAYDPAPKEDDDVPFGMVQNKSWGANFGVYYFDLDMVSSEKLLDTDLNKMLYYEAYDKYFDYVVDKSYPLLPIDSDVMAEYNDLSVTLTEAIDKAFAAFVTGEKSIDKDWDSYIKELKGYGLDRLVKMAQQRYDKYGKN